MDYLSLRDKARSVLGLETQNIDHPMWQDVFILNDLKKVTLYQDGEVFWQGIINVPERVDALADLLLKYPEMRVMIVDLISS